MNFEGFTFVTLDDIEYTYGVNFSAHTSERKYLEDVGDYLTLAIL